MSQKQHEATQSSLHSFFKPSAASQQSGLNAAEAVDLTGSPPAKRARLETSAASQTLSGPSSGYFKRDAGPSVSKTPRPPSSSSLANPRRSVALESYRLARAREPSTGGDDPGVVRVPRTAEQEQRRAAFHRIVGDRALGRRRSLVLDDAAAAEARRLAGEGEPGVGGDKDDHSRELSREGTTRDATPEPESAVAASLRSKYAAAPSKGRAVKRKKTDEVGPSGMTYTPLERQFMDIKARWPDVLLMMEVGYKYKFHGDDAKRAAKELGIMAFPNRNFYTASIPTHRLHIHVKKLISLGYKVGVVSQMETAALKKVGDNRNTPFTRQLTHLYTAATYVEESSVSSSNLRDGPLLPGAAPPPTNALVAVVERTEGRLDDRARIALVSVVPNTGDVVYDEFDDSAVRSELETRLTHLQPAELILPSAGLSRATEKALRHVADASTSATAVRVERVDVPTYSDAFDSLSAFYRAKDDGPIDLTDDGDGDGDGVVGESIGDSNGHGAENETHDVDPIDLARGLSCEDAVLALVDFPKQVVVALAMCVKYMTPFGLQNAFRNRSSFVKFANRAHMLLSSNTLVNLEIYRNQTDGGILGSLLWLGTASDRPNGSTKTRMGRRLMREWIGRPLLDVAALRARADAIEEIMTDNTYHMEKLRSLLVNLPDLVRGLTRVQYGKTTPSELATILTGLLRVASEFQSSDSKAFKSSLLNSIVEQLPTIAEPTRAFLAAIDMKAAKAGNQADLWADPDRYPDIQDAKDCIAVCESELDLHLKEVRKVVRRPALNYVTVSGIEYLVEVPQRDAKSVPAKWVKISSTKSVVRFHTPEILRLTKEREQHKETLAGAAKRAFLDFQGEISECHELLVVSRQIAVVDCLMSLASVASAGGYTKPTFVAEPCLEIRAGRHPMVEALREEQYVPFDIGFSEGDGRAKVITGPNMAGKSSCVRAVALIVVMAQIGSFVPAAEVTLGIHDAVQTRMGASDDIGRGKSTFMVELSETSDILRTVTPRTLVILDELGRGTSTYDGVAIAYATLAHLADAQCHTLFVTHYPMVAEQLAAEHPAQVSNWHMAFTQRTAPDGFEEITFLYRLERGLADASFGVWCARLAGLPAPVLRTAQERADALKADTRSRGVAALGSRLRDFLMHHGAGTGAASTGGAGGTNADADSKRQLARVARLESALAFVRATGPSSLASRDSPSAHT